jgi:hypothetical protein
MNLARSSNLKHKLGSILTTPLLVPSFSSKGLGFIPSNKKFGFKGKPNQTKISETNQIMASASQIITDTALVSAFDVAQGFIPKPEDFIMNTELLFVDSGGYETTNYYDLSDIFKAPPYRLNWTKEEHTKVLQKWPLYMPSVFISFDQNIEFLNQVEDAQKLAAAFPKQLSSFLIKPEKKENITIPLKSIYPHIEELKHFDIIGVTEKELGHSILARMQNIAEFRMALDKAGIIAPIHIFGSLDPVTTCLYFLSGAEIFDGLTWSKFSYWNGLAAYKPNYGACEIGINIGDDQVITKTLFDNLYYLKKLESKMQEFTINQDFKVFPHHADFLQESYNTLISKLK